MRERIRFLSNARIIGILRPQKRLRLDTVIMGTHLVVMSTYNNIQHSFNPEISPQHTFYGFCKVVFKVVL